MIFWVPIRPVIYTVSDNSSETSKLSAKIDAVIPQHFYDESKAGRGDVKRRAEVLPA